ncbi:MAG: TetR family transcriptional regulator [Leucobacter sp.]
MAKTNVRSAQTRITLMEATLRVAAEHGIAAVSYRRVVNEAGLSLGTASYHFDDFNDLLLESFSYFVEQIAERYREPLESATTQDELVEAVLRVSTAIRQDEQDTVLLLTLYSEAARNPAYAQLVKSWSRAVKQQISHIVDEADATKVEILWVGVILQRAVFDHGLGDDELRDMIVQAITKD